MRGYTHLAGGLLVGLLFAKAFPNLNVFFVIITALFASAFPDIDYSYSLIGKHFKFVGMMFSHRGFFHSIWALLLFSALFFLITQSTIYALIFAAGYLSHLILDIIYAPMDLFWPKKGYHGRTRAAGAFLNILFFVLLIIVDLWVIVG
jgi:membrane-bound metal-dependent hydrolase YbcI (DUF457 family)